MTEEKQKIEQRQGGEKGIKELLKKSEISLWLDHYDDIFSDFDPRPYSQRGISDDFLKEARKAVRETKLGVLELRFLVPENHQKQEHEAMIKKRLREHFRKHADLLRIERRESIRRGTMMAATGFLSLLAAAAVDYYNKEAFLWSLVTVIMEPAGWFTIWYGLDLMIFKSREKAPEQEFYEKIAKADISFDTY